MVKIMSGLVLIAMLVGCTSQQVSRRAMPLSKADPGKQVHQGMIAHPDNPYFYNFVGALPDSDIKDNPETFLSPFDGKDIIILERFDAGELYGHRVALRHIKGKRKSEYTPSPQYKDGEFIKGFLAGYNSTMKGSANQ